MLGGWTHSPHVGWFDCIVCGLCRGFVVCWAVGLISVVCWMVCMYFCPVDMMSTVAATIQVAY